MKELQESEPGVTGVKENKMGTMPENKLILTMSIPIVISMLVQALYNIVDSIFVAQINENALTAVSLAFPVQNLMIAVATGTGVGINALLSKSLGERKQDTVNRSANIGITLAMCSYVIFAAIGIFFSGAFYEIQTNVDEIVTYGKSYMSVVTICSFGLFLQVTCERLLQGTGKTLFSMITQCCGAVINLILDPILIFGYFGMPKMGVEGAAIATVIGQIVAGILAYILNVKVNKEIHFAVKYMRPKASIIAKIYEVGVPSIIMASIASVLTFGMNKILIGFSTTATAVFGVYFKLNSFLFMPVFGLNNGLIPILGYNYGARKPARIKKTIRLGMTYAVSIMLVGFIVFQIIPDKLLLLFNASADMQKIGDPALRIIAYSFIFAGFNIVCSTVFQAIGNPVHSLLMSVTRQLVVILPVAYLLSLTGNIDLIWLSFPIAEVVAMLMSLFFIRRTMKKIEVLEEEVQA